LAVLLLLWGGAEFLARGSDTVTGSLGLPAVDQAAVDSVTIVKGADSIVLAKQASTAWTVNGHPAALSAVGDLFQALKDTVRPELVAQDPSSFARLGVDSARAGCVSAAPASRSSPCSPGAAARSSRACMCGAPTTRTCTCGGAGWRRCSTAAPTTGATSGSRRSSPTASRRSRWRAAPTATRCGGPAGRGA